MIKKSGSSLSLYLREMAKCFFLASIYVSDWEINLTCSVKRSLVKVSKINNQKEKTNIKWLLIYLPDLGLKIKLPQQSNSTRQRVPSSC